MKYTQHKFEKLNVPEPSHLERCNNVGTVIARSGVIGKVCASFP
jgi:hypothetical protein